MERLQAFVEELRRRRVIRALLAWGILSFALLQVYEPVMHGLHLPEWTLTFVVVGLGMGFPATMVLAWIFDLKPTGVERTAPAQISGSRLFPLLLALGVLAAAPGLFWFFVWHKSPAHATAEQASIAVLPLRNLSGDASQEYFSEGMTEEITSKLSRLRGLLVASRTSAIKYKASPLSAREIGAELNVAYLVEGSVRRAGDRIRVTAALVRAADAVQVWSDDLDARLDDVFSVQQAVASRIVEALGVKLSATEASSLSDWGTRNVAAYDEFLKGAARYAGGGPDSQPAVMEAMAHFEKALVIDPQFAPALAYLAAAECAYYRDWDSSPERIARAEALTSKALALDPRLPVALHAAAAVRANRFDYAGAAVLLRRVVQEQPRDHLAWDQLCWALGYMIPPVLDEAEAACTKALALQPDYVSSYYHLARVHVQRRQLDLARADLGKIEARDPKQHLIPLGRFWVELADSHPREALAELEKARTAAGETNLIVAWRAVALGQIGDLDAAFAALERTLKDGYRDQNDLRASAAWAPLRGDPRWAQTLQRHGLQP